MITMDLLSSAAHRHAKTKIKKKTDMIGIRLFLGSTYHTAIFTIFQAANHHQSIVIYMLILKRAKYKLFYEST